MCVPEWIPVTKRPMMTISGELQILLKPMSELAMNTSTVVFTTVPFLKVHTQPHNKEDGHYESIYKLIIRRWMKPRGQRRSTGTTA